MSNTDNIDAPDDQMRCNYKVTREALGEYADDYDLREVNGDVLDALNAAFSARLAEYDEPAKAWVGLSGRVYWGDPLADSYLYPMWEGWEYLRRDLAECLASIDLAPILYRHDKTRQRDNGGSAELCNGCHFDSETLTHEPGCLELTRACVGWAGE